MPQLDTYLFFDGTCAQAMRFYEKALGATLETAMTYADMPGEEKPAPGAADRILHASLLLDGRRLMASDSMPGETYGGMHGFAVSLNHAHSEIDEAKRHFEALLEGGGKVIMPMAATFFSPAFGMLTDRFGTTWMVGCDSPPEA
jgi:PhnB protein